MRMVGARIGPRDVDRLDFAKSGGLLPAVIQDVGTGAVLMLGYMNREAVLATLSRGRVVFFSRSNERLWEKGESSGHSLELNHICADCDGDSLLVLVRPHGPTCHKGTRTCFEDSSVLGSDPLRFLSDLDGLIAQRMLERPEGSYTTTLLDGGIRRIAQKVGEEGLEVALAAVAGSDDDVLAEFADLIYHLLVLLRARGLRLEQVVDELRGRHASAQALTG
ncbi:MAG: bifunctional phosphoribosyl-AMP cyclohydrolase/phosphoribosyl-ATP diphosphatase HisIE [Terriglobales bacterium]